MKLLASDFDNTLWFGNHMKKKDIWAIQRFQKHGNLFGLCTGRTLEGVLRPSQPYRLTYDFYILLSGGLILDKNFEVIFESKIPLTIVKEIYKLLNDQDMSVVCQNQVYALYKNSHYMQANEIQSLDELHVEEVNAFSFHFHKNEIEKATAATQKILEKYGDDVAAFQNNQHIDLAAKGCSKGAGIKIIQEHFHLEEDCIYGIGDSWNDIPMLKSVGHGYTFAYAPKDVQSLAEKVVGSLAEGIRDIENKKRFVFFQKR